MFPRRMLYLSVWTVVSGFAIAFAHAQSAALPARGVIAVEEIASPASPTTTSRPAQPAGSSTADNTAAQDAQLKQQRMQKLQQLTFDRRPSAILLEWSKQESEKTAAKNVDNDGPAVAPKPKTPIQEFDEELAAFKRAVTLGNWDDVKSFLAELEEDEAKAAYAKLLQSMLQTPSGFPVGIEELPGLNPQQKQRLQSMLAESGRQNGERNNVSFTDLLGLAAAAPHKLEAPTMTMLSQVVRISLQGGYVIENLVEILRKDVAKPEAERAFTSRQAAELLFRSGHVLEGAEFLPDAEKAKADADLPALNMLSQVYLARYQKEKKSPLLETAWELTQIVFRANAEPEADSNAEKRKQRATQRAEALKRAVELAPRVREKLGEAWLHASFTNDPDRGMEIIATIGQTAAQNVQQQMHNPAERLKDLKLQTTAVNALLEITPERAAQWSGPLNLLAANWLREGQITYQYDQSTSYGSHLRRDRYGNFFYLDEGIEYPGYSPYSGNRPQPVKTGELLETKPADAWLDLIDASLQPKFQMLFAQLYLKVQEEDRAFPYIEQLATTHPRQAENLVDEFLQVWTRNHDPNADRNRTSYYMWMYGYDRRAEGIPLTRSKQERNLQELSALVRRLEALPLERINEQLLAKAFTTCHSSAEVYRLEAIEKVFGPIDDLKPQTLAELAQQMRANLSGIWRAPAEQEQKKTKRKKQDIQAEVFRGYEVARTVIEDALQKHSQSWELQLALASIEHDENNYRRDIANDSGFTPRQREAFEKFQRAAELYTQGLPKLDAEKQTTKAYELWFYASLGAVDLGQVNKERAPDLRQPAIIREAIQSLPGDLAEDHMTLFANTMFTRLSSVGPEMKFRYLKGGFEIVGDHERAREARKVFDYYNDLVTEIKLDAVVDGGDAVGHEQPFGLFVNLRHTREIERESGGFGRYLQNQNNMYYSYNYGRPTENYREKFEETVQQAFAEHFEVLSVTFQEPDVNSRALAEYGWRVTPYAYILLRARGPEVDKVPPLRLDLDFLDTSGYAVLPIESPPLPIDAKSTAPEPRPFEKLKVTQTLDERQADEGKLILEVKATAQGLVPELDEILLLKSPGFEIVETEDQGVSVSRFDPDSPENVVVSERLWMMTLQAADQLAELPGEFSFGTAVAETDEMLYQRFDDADLAAVESKISLEQEYGEVDRSGMWLAIALGGLVSVLVIAGIVFFRRLRRQELQAARFTMPEPVTPFTVIGLLKQIEHNNGFDTEKQRELAASINRIEHYYFAHRDGQEPDLEQIASGWISTAT